MEGVQPGRIQYLDVLRVLSMLSVVFLHTAAGSLRTAYGSSVWHFANALSSLASASIPLFFMISGALLLSSPKTDSVRFTLGTRLPRVLLPFIAWSLIAVAYYLLIGWKISGSPDWGMATEKLKNFPSTPTAIHLWFMYPLIPLYLLSPLIRKVTNNAGRDLVVYMIAIWLVFSSLLPTIAAFLPKAYRPLVTLDVRYNLSIMAGYAGYFIFGYYLSRLNARFPKPALAAIVFVFTVVIALGTWWKTSSSGLYVESFKTYTGLFVVILSTAVFLLCKEVLRERSLGTVARATVGFLAPLSFGIYLIHLLFVDLVTKLTYWLPARSVWVMIFAYVAILVASTVCIFVASGIKPLCYVLTGRRYANWRTRWSRPASARAAGRT